MVLTEEIIRQLWENNSTVEVDSAENFNVVLLYLYNNHPHSEDDNVRPIPDHSLKVIFTNEINYQQEKAIPSVPFENFSSTDTLSYLELNGNNYSIKNIVEMNFNRSIYHFSHSTIKNLYFEDCYFKGSNYTFLGFYNFSIGENIKIERCMFDNVTNFVGIHSDSGATITNYMSAATIKASSDTSSFNYVGASGKDYSGVELLDLVICQGSSVLSEGTCFSSFTADHFYSKNIFKGVKTVYGIRDSEVFWQGYLAIQKLNIDGTRNLTNIKISDYQDILYDRELLTGISESQWDETDSYGGIGISTAKFSNLELLIKKYGFNTKKNISYSNTEHDNINTISDFVTADSNYSLSNDITGYKTVRNIIIKSLTLYGVKLLNDPTTYTIKLRLTNNIYDYDFPTTNPEFVVLNFNSPVNASFTIEGEGYLPPNQETLNPITLRSESFSDEISSINARMYGFIGTISLNEEYQDGETLHQGTEGLLWNFIKWYTTGYTSDPAPMPHFSITYEILDVPVWKINSTYPYFDILRYWEEYTPLLHIQLFEGYSTQNLFSEIYIPKNEDFTFPDIQNKTETIINDNWVIIYTFDGWTDNTGIFYAVGDSYHFSSTIIPDEFQEVSFFAHYKETQRIPKILNFYISNFQELKDFYQKILPYNEVESNSSYLDENALIIRGFITADIDCQGQSFEIKRANYLNVMLDGQNHTIFNWKQNLNTSHLDDTADYYYIDENEMYFFGNAVFKTATSKATGAVDIIISGVKNLRIKNFTFTISAELSDEKPCLIGSKENLFYAFGFYGTVLENISFQNLLFDFGNWSFSRRSISDSTILNFFSISSSTGMSALKKIQVQGQVKNIKNLFFDFHIFSILPSARNTFEGLESCLIFNNIGSESWNELNVFYSDSPLQTRFRQCYDLNTILENCHLTTYRMFGFKTIRDVYINCFQCYSKITELGAIQNNIYETTFKLFEAKSSSLTFYLNSPNKIILCINDDETDEENLYTKHSFSENSLVTFIKSENLINTQYMTENFLFSFDEPLINNYIATSINESTDDYSQYIPVLFYYGNSEIKEPLDMINIKIPFKGAASTTYWAQLSLSSNDGPTYNNFPPQEITTDSSGKGEFIISPIENCPSLITDNYGSNNPNNFSPWTINRMLSLNFYLDKNKQSSTSVMMKGVPGSIETLSFKDDVLLFTPPPSYPEGFELEIIYQFFYENAPYEWISDIIDFYEGVPHLFPAIEDPPTPQYKIIGIFIVKRKSDLKKI